MHLPWYQLLYSKNLLYVPSWHFRIFGGFFQHLAITVQGPKVGVKLSPVFTGPVGQKTAEPERVSWVANYNILLVKCWPSPCLRQDFIWRSPVQRATILSDRAEVQVLISWWEYEFGSTYEHLWCVKMLNPETGILFLTYIFIPMNITVKICFIFHIFFFPPLFPISLPLQSNKYILYLPTLCPYCYVLFHFCFPLQN